MKNEIFKKSILIIGAMIFFYLSHRYQAKLMPLLAQLQLMNGIHAFLIFCSIYVLSNLLLLPFGLPLNFLAGMLWGTFLGGAMVNLLATFVAAISFLLARKFGHYYSEMLFNKYIILRQFKNMINKFDWQFIAMARINPLVPFGISNYLFGFIPQLSFKHYIIATVFSNLFPCFLFASIGSVLKLFPVDLENLHKMIWNLGLTLMLISGAIIVRMWVSAKKNQSSHKISENSLL